MAQQLISNTTPISAISECTVLVDGSIASSSSPYIINNTTYAICDTVTYGNVFIQLTQGTYTDSSSGQAVSDTNQFVVVQNANITGTVTITPTGGITINGAASYTLQPNFIVKLVLDSSSHDWAIVMVSVLQGTTMGGGGSSTTNAVVRWKGAGGNQFNDSLVTIDSSNNITIPTIPSVNITGTITTTNGILSNTTNTLATAATSPGGSGSVIIGAFTGPLTNTTNSVVVGAASNTTSLSQLSTCTDSIVMTGIGFQDTTSVTNTVAVSLRTTFTGALSDAIILTTFGPIPSPLTVGARPTIIGAINTTVGAIPTTYGDDSIIVAQTLVRDKAAMRGLYLGFQGLLNSPTQSPNADIIYIIANINGDAASSTNTDNRSILIGTTTAVSPNSSNTILFGNQTSITLTSSTNCVGITMATTSTSCTDSVIVSNKIGLNTGLRTVVFAKTSLASTISSLADVTWMTSGANISTDTTKAGITVLPVMTAGNTGCTGFGFNIASTFNSGTNNTLAGTGITSGLAFSTVTTLSVSSAFSGSNTALVLLGNGFTASGSTTAVGFVVGAITSVSNRLLIGTATTPINTSTTVGAAGTASAPPTPAQYLRATINGTSVRIPLFNP